MNDKQSKPVNSFARRQIEQQEQINGPSQPRGQSFNVSNMNFADKPEIKFTKQPNGRYKPVTFNKQFREPTAYNQPQMAESSEDEFLSARSGESIEKNGIAVPITHMVQQKAVAPFDSPKAQKPGPLLIKKPTEEKKVVNREDLDRYSLIQQQNQIKISPMVQQQLQAKPQQMSNFFSEEEQNEHSFGDMDEISQQSQNIGELSQFNYIEESKNKTNVPYRNNQRKPCNDQDQDGALPLELIQKQEAVIRPFYGQQLAREENKEEQQFQCECSHCSKLINFDQLNEHEEQCGRQASENLITKMVEEQAQSQPIRNNVRSLEQVVDFNESDSNQSEEPVFVNDPRRVRDDQPNIPIVRMIENQINLGQSAFDYPRPNFDTENDQASNDHNTAHQNIFENNPEQNMLPKIEFSRTSHPSGVVSRGNRYGPQNPNPLLLSGNGRITQNTVEIPAGDGDGGADNQTRSQVNRMGPGNMNFSGPGRSGTSLMSGGPGIPKLVDRFLEQAVESDQSEEELVSNMNPTGFQFVPRRQEINDNFSEGSEGENFAVSYHPGPRRQQFVQNQESQFNQAAFFENSDDEGHFQNNENLVERLEQAQQNAFTNANGARVRIAPLIQSHSEQLGVEEENLGQQQPSVQEMIQVRQSYNERLQAGIQRLLGNNRPRVPLEYPGADIHALDHEGDEEDSEEDYEDLLELDEDGDVPIPVTKQMQEQLPHTKFTQANRENFSEENQTCTVCQSQYEVEEEYVILPCLHRFHTECVAPWFERKNTCPVCKQPVNLGESAQPQVNRAQRQVVNMLLRAAVNQNAQSEYEQPEAVQRGARGYLHVPVRDFFPVGEEADEGESDEDDEEFKEVERNRAEVEYSSDNNQPADSTNSWPSFGNQMGQRQQRPQQEFQFMPSRAQPAQRQPNFQTGQQLQVQTRLQDMNLNPSPWSNQQSNNRPRYTGAISSMLFVEQPDSPQQQQPELGLPVQMISASNQRPANNPPSNTNQANNRYLGTIFERSAFAFEEPEDEQNQSFGEK